MKWLFIWDIPEIDFGGKFKLEVRDEVEIVDKGVADIAVGQQPEARSRRIRKPNSKYDPAVFDLGSIEIRGIPLSGKKNGWRGVYWPS